MGAETSKFDPVIPESCTLENFKEMKQVFENKIKEFDGRLKTLQQTMKDQTKAEAKDKARSTSIQIKQLEIVRGIYLKIIPDIVGSILLLEESEPIISLLKMMPTLKGDDSIQIRTKQDHKKNVFVAIACAFADNLKDDIFDMTEVSEVTCWKESVIEKLITAPKIPAASAAAANRKDKDKV